MEYQFIAASVFSHNQNVNDILYVTSYLSDRSELRNKLLHVNLHSKKEYEALY